MVASHDYEDCIPPCPPGKGPQDGYWSHFECPVCGSNQYGSMRNPDGTWTRTCHGFVSPEQECVFKSHDSHDHIYFKTFTPNSQCPHFVGQGPVWHPINLNDYVRVRLTHAGRAMFLASDVPREVNGWSEWQLHRLMLAFGHRCCPGAQLCFDPNIIHIGPNPTQRNDT